ncbi:hypothetical protein Tco_0238438 [Tanacetum coccineum]
MTLVEETKVPVEKVLGRLLGDVVETDIQEKNKKKAKSKQIRARNGKDKVKSQAKLKKIQLERAKTCHNLKFLQRERQGLNSKKVEMYHLSYTLEGTNLPYSPKKVFFPAQQTQLQLLYKSPCWQSLIHSKTFSMAKIVSKKPQKELTARIAVDLHTTSHTCSFMSTKKHKVQDEDLGY